MSNLRSAITIVWADDDPDDRLLIQDALSCDPWRHQVRFVDDGEELLDYLQHRGKYASRDSSPRPSLILLDLNMPRRDGREALQEIKGDPALRHIPIVVITTSKAEGDIDRSYDLGVSSYISKPTSYEELVEMMRTLGKYWCEVVRLPGRGNGH